MLYFLFYFFRHLGEMWWRQNISHHCRRSFKIIWRRYANTLLIMRVIPNLTLISTTILVFISNPNPNLSQMFLTVAPISSRNTCKYIHMLKLYITTCLTKFYKILFCNFHLNEQCSLFRWLALCLRSTIRSKTSRNTKGSIMKCRIDQRSAISCTLSDVRYCTF